MTPLGRAPVLDRVMPYATLNSEDATDAQKKTATAMVTEASAPYFHLDEIEKAYQSWAHPAGQPLDHVLKTCRWCAGWAYKGNTACGVCQGRGSVKVIQPARECPHCEGRGRSPNRRTACWACGGSGWANASSPG